MSNIPQDVLDQLVQVLANLVSNDNTIRSAAEEQLNNEWMVKSPDALLSGFAYLSRHREEPDVSLVFAKCHLTEMERLPAPTTGEPLISTFN